MIKHNLLSPCVVDIDDHDNDVDDDNDDDDDDDKKGVIPSTCLCLGVGVMPSSVDSPLSYPSVQCSMALWFHCEGAAVEFRQREGDVKAGRAWDKKYRLSHQDFPELCPATV
jgi:hypothetical protein